MKAESRLAKLKHLMDSRSRWFAVRAFPVWRVVMGMVVPVIARERG